MDPEALTIAVMGVAVAALGLTSIFLALRVEALSRHTVDLGRRLRKLEYDARAPYTWREPYE